MKPNRKHGPFSLNLLTSIKQVVPLLLTKSDHLLPFTLSIFSLYHIITKPKDAIIVHYALCSAELASLHQRIPIHILYPKVYLMLILFSDLQNEALHQIHLLKTATSKHKDLVLFDLDP